MSILSVAFVSALNDFTGVMSDSYIGFLWLAWPLIGIPSFFISVWVYLKSDKVIQRWSGMLFFLDVDYSHIPIFPYSHISIFTILYFCGELLDSSPGGEQVVIVYVIISYIITAPVWVSFIVFWAWLSTRQ